jgi:predicted transcriptional regulator
MSSSIGELESEVLSVLQYNGKATASEVLEVLAKKRDKIAYTTVSTTLDRLYKKHLLERKGIPGPGGFKYVFSIGKDRKLRSRIVESSFGRLTNAFGDSAYSALYKHIETMEPEELEHLKKQVDKALEKARSKSV